MNQRVLQATGLTRAFRPAGSGAEVTVLRGVDLQLSSGELVTLAGPSGSGKSALLAILAGFDHPENGAVTVAGLASGARPPWSALALVPQSLGLLEELTLEENAASPLLFSRDPADRAGALERAASLLDQLGVGTLARRYPAEVSLGQQQRVALARGLIGGPAVLLADEPTAHLDHRTIDQVIDVLLAAVATGTTCLLATHDEALTRRAHRRFEMHHGKLVDTGPGEAA